MSSKFGLKVGNGRVYNISSPEEALKLISTIVEQYLGLAFTTYNPCCPICDSNLSDHEKNMNKPVGECTNDKCNSTIYPSDYFGKILDILGEYDKCKEESDNRQKETVLDLELDLDDDDQEDTHTGFLRGRHGRQGHTKFRTKNKFQVATGSQSAELEDEIESLKDEDFVRVENGEVIFLW